MLFAIIVVPVSGQTGTGANFGVEAKLYSGDQGPNVDDWFPGPTGLGVITEDSTAIFQGRISSALNEAFYANMSRPVLSMNNGSLWYAGVFGHDYITLDSSRNPTADDTVFDEANNATNPGDWDTERTAINARADIMDIYAHVRREGNQATDSLWIMTGAAMTDNSGSHYLDFEFFISDIQHSGTSFTNLGPEDGHTAWKFDASGNVLQMGDMILRLDFSGASILNTRLRIWVSRNDYQNNIGFNYVNFRAEDPASNYGYARIDLQSFVLSQVNAASTTAPPWGTFDNGAIPSAVYQQHGFAEMGVNLTGMGLDPVQHFGSASLCTFPYSSFMVKSRTTSGFKSDLIDFAGPYSFLGMNQSQPDTAIDTPPVIDSCTYPDEEILRAANSYPTLEYQWTVLSPGVTFPSGDTQIRGIGLDSVAINYPGEYELNIFPNALCPASPGNATSVTVGSRVCAVNDSIYVETDNSRVIEVWHNDVDLDDNIVYTTVNNAGLKAPDNGNIVIAPTGEITYTPNPGYTGMDDFEYQICDSDGYCDVASVIVDVTSPVPPPFEDSDGDGILDKEDLDDDNDGIPDLIEQSVIVDTSQPACGGETDLIFSSPPVLISGVDKQEGAVYRVADVTAGVDALITVTQIYNATIYNIDNNGSDPHAFRPDTQFTFANAGDQAMVEYKIRFVNSGGTSPVIVDRFFMNFNDIDGTPQYAEQTWALNPTNYVISNPTELTMYTDGEWVVGTAGTTTYGGASNANPQVNFGANYDSKSEMTIRVGAVARVDGASALYRLHHIEFLCITNYVNPQVYGMDYDYDGVANHLDLDSDNDGIYEAVEAGHDQAHSSGVVNGPYGANGLADVVESAPESGLLNFTVRDTDGIDGNDYLDLDSDDDACSDANEAYSNASADGGDNYFYGTGNPPLINDDGTVFAASYNIPADVDSNSNPDYMEFSAPMITAHPQDQEICIGEDATFSVGTVNANVYQWQKNIAGVWTNLTDSGIYSGTLTSELLLTGVPVSENNSEYRVLVSNDTYVCLLPSQPAQLIINTPNIVANASATTINSGESVTLTGSGGVSYSWDNGITDGETVVLYATTTFTVTGTDASGCTNTDSITVVVNASSDISLDKFPANDIVNVGEEVQFTIRVTNSGPDPATNIVVEDILPPGLALITVENDGVILGNKVIWTIPFLDVGGIDLTYTVRVNPPRLIPDEYKNIAQVTEVDQDDPDSDPNNDGGNQDEDDEDSYTLPTPTAEISIFKSADVTHGYIGDPVTFTVEVTNSGTYDATNVEVEDLLPQGFSLVAVNTTAGIYEYATGLWSIPRVSPGSTETLTMDVTITDVDAYLNIAILVYVDQLDPDPGDDESQVEIILDNDDCLTVYNEFSPNKDGLNDFFYIECIQNYPDNYLQVFDRWGSLVYAKEKYNNDWEGHRSVQSVLGKETQLPVGTYFYILSLDYERKSDKTGWLYISR